MKKTTHRLLLVTFLLLFSCSDEKRVIYDEVEIRGEIVYYQNKPFTGVLYNFIENSRHLFYEKGYKDGLEHGIQKKWYKNGTLYSERFFKDGEKNGTEKYYGQDGVLIETHNYLDGKMDGIQVYYYSNGEMNIERCYKNGTKDGIYKEYDENGKLKYKGQWSKGEPDGLHQWFDEDGNVTDDCLYENGQMFLEINPPSD